MVSVMGILGMSFITIQMILLSVCYQSAQPYCTLTLLQPLPVLFAVLKSLIKIQLIWCDGSSSMPSQRISIEIRGKTAWLIYIQLGAPYCMSHKAICFCSYFHPITLTDRAHSLSSDEVWWWRLMMSASSHHHLASSTLFYYCFDSHVWLLFERNHCLERKTFTVSKGLWQHNPDVSNACTRHLLLHAN